MKNYALNSHSASVGHSVQAPFNFKIETIEPPVGTPIYRIYSNTGNYLGWTADAAAIKKYLYGWLYYKTKGWYKVETTKVGYGRDQQRTNQRIKIYHRETGLIALNIRYVELVHDDFYDKNDVDSAADIALRKFRSNYAAFTVPSPFWEGKEQFEHLHKELTVKLNELCGEYAKKIIAHLEAKARQGKTLTRIADLRFNLSQAKKEENPAA